MVTVKDASSEIVYRLGKLSKIDVSRLDKNSFKNTKTIKTYEGKKTLKHFVAIRLILFQWNKSKIEKLSLGLEVVGAK